MRSNRLFRGDNVGYLYILPWIIGFLCFQLYPFIASFFYSLTDLTLLRPSHFVGLENYKELFTQDKTFRESSFVTVKYVLISVPLKLMFALFIAMLLNMKIRHINFFKTFYYLPSILGSCVGISILWRFLFNRTGFVNMMLGTLHIPPVDWLGNPDLALYTISMLSVWQFGSSMVLFLAALQQIPASLYEAAVVDGAGRVRLFLKITIPLISPIILFNLVMQMINAFQEFSAPYLITGGGPTKATYLYGLMLYDNTFKYLKMGYSSAQSWVLFVTILAFTVMIFKSSKYWTFYEDGGKF
jgi:oligogalacturonide transport system permease protein